MTNRTTAQRELEGILSHEKRDRSTETIVVGDLTLALVPKDFQAKLAQLPTKTFRLFPGEIRVAQRLFQKTGPLKDKIQQSVRNEEYQEVQTTIENALKIQKNILGHSKNEIKIKPSEINSSGGYFVFELTRVPIFMEGRAVPQEVKEYVQNKRAIVLVHVTGIVHFWIAN